MIRQWPILALILTSCASTVRLPVPMMVSPQVLGKNRGSVALGNASAVQQEVVRAWKDTEPLVEPNALSGSPLGPLIDGEFAWHDRFQVGARINMGAPLVARAQYQFFGPPTSAPKEFGFVGSVVAELGFTLQTESDTRSSIDKDSYSYTHLVYGVGLVAGVTLGESWIPYAGYLYRSHSVSGSVEQTRGEFNTTSTGIAASGSTSGWMLGAHWEAADLFLRAEFGNFTNNMGGLELEGAYHFGALLGIRY